MATDLEILFKDKTIEVDHVVGALLRGMSWEMLLDHPEDVSPVTTSVTPLWVPQTYYPYAARVRKNMEADQKLVYIAVHERDVDLLRVLLAAGARPNQLAIMLCWAAHPDPGVFKWLLRAGADPDMPLHGMCTYDAPGEIVYDAQSTETFRDYVNAYRLTTAQAILHAQAPFAGVDRPTAGPKTWMRADTLKGLTARACLQVHDRQNYHRLVCENAVLPHLLPYFCFFNAGAMAIRVGKDGAVDFL